MKPYFLGIDLGGTNIKTGIVDYNGAILATESIPTEASEGPEAGIQKMCQSAQKVVSQIKGTWDDIAAIGIGAPGTMDLSTGTLLNPHNLPGWQQLPLKKRISDTLGRPAILQNDANAAAYGEYWVGAGSQSESMVLFTLGTGIGCGVIIDDIIIEGKHSHGAEAGHLIVQMQGGRQCACGRFGCLEAYASATALTRRARDAMNDHPESEIHNALNAGEKLTPLLLSKMASSGDPFSREIIMTTARYLGVGIVNMMHVIDPDLIVLGGAMTFGCDDQPLGRSFRATVEQEITQRAFPVPATETPVCFGELGSKAGFIGAAGCARLAHRHSAET